MSVCTMTKRIVARCTMFHSVVDRSLFFAAAVSALCVRCLTKKKGVPPT